MAKLTLDEKIDLLMIDMAAIKTDVTWLKRLFGGIILITGGIFGIDASGLLV